MQHTPENYMQGRRDSVRDRIVQKWLRTQPDSDRLAFVTTCLQLPARDGRAYQLAVATIARPVDALSILREYLDTPDPSGIKWWLAFGIQKLGGLRVVREVAAYIDRQPDTVSMAVYWLPGLVPQSQIEAREEMNVLISEANRRRIVRGPRTRALPDGTRLFMNVYADRPSSSERAEQAGAGQPATRSVEEPEGGDKPQPEAEGRRP